ncbi:zinc ribbon domain-containing protein [Eisenibacter elegans]|jgi:predicted  nucleic acid-binding Zn-ribbon protein|uniref:zinc ribbon domain-containing protein n=1 Tax=Eisenibacter elegans TaxID=997 RepID=UPI00042A38CC|nr:C4-type zinc ribbon domain-containing protein [Eisenibacter elegans]
MERTVAQKLTALLKLQSIDTQLDEIKKIRGDLPEEVQDLEDEIAGYQTRIDKFNAEIDALRNEITGFRERRKEAEKLITKYKDQQMNVRNNREYDAITKEIESEELEITLCDKKIRTTEEKIKGVEADIKQTQDTLADRNKDLENKKSELDSIIAESEGEEQKLVKDREKSAKNIEDRLLRSYNRIRENAINGLAVVMVQRDACGGCFNIVPPQRQADVRDQKKIIVCEHCGRILAGVDDPVVVVEEEKKPKPAPKKKASKAE